MKATNQLFTENNKKLLDNIMSKEEGVIYFNSVIDPKHEDFDKSLEQLTFEAELEKRIKDGYIDEIGTPLKCVCGCKKFTKVNIYNDEGYEVEYSLECKNEICFKIVGTWSYGNWQL